MKKLSCLLGFGLLAFSGCNKAPESSPTSSAGGGAKY